MILAPNEYAYISDETKGEVNVYVGPNKQSLAGTDRCVTFDLKTKRFKSMPSLEIGSGGNPQPGYFHLERFIHPNDRHLVDICGDASRLPFGSGVFDSVLMFGVFEHFGIFEIQEVMLEIVRVLRDGGDARAARVLHSPRRVGREALCHRSGRRLPEAD